MMKKLILRCCLMMATCLILYSCRNEIENLNRTYEKGDVNYGISYEAFISSLLAKNIGKAGKSNLNKNTNTAANLSPEQLAERLNLDSAAYNNNNGVETLHIPVRTFGNYKRSLLSFSKGESSKAFLLTYPNSNNHKLFYITNLNGEFIKEVKIGDDGKEINSSLGKNSTMNKGYEECPLTLVYITCSKNIHSFEWGNSHECIFWTKPQNGTPPSVFAVSGSCSFGGSSGTGDGDIGTGDGSGLGGGTSPVGGGGGPKYDLTNADCITNLDCGECNIPGDANNDCILTYEEAIAYLGINQTPCEKTKAMLANPEIKPKVDELINHANSGANYEKGWRINKTGSPTEAASNGNNSVIAGPPNLLNGFYHNHTGKEVDIFSATDISTLIEIARYQNIGSAGNAYVGLVAPNGIHYVIYFNGSHGDLPPIKTTQQEKDQWETQTLTWNTQQKILLLAFLKKNEYTQIINGKKMLNNKALEKILFDTIEKMNLTNKITVQKIDDNNTVSTIVQNQDKTTTPIPCP